MTTERKASKVVKSGFAILALFFHRFEDSGVHNSKIAEVVAAERQCSINGSH